MVGISIRWREGAFECEFHADGTSGLLVLLRDDELIHQERVDSLGAASERASELSRLFETPRAKQA